MSRQIGNTSPDRWHPGMGDASAPLNGIRAVQYAKDLAARLIGDESVKPAFERSSVAPFSIGEDSVAFTDSLETSPEPSAPSEQSVRRAHVPSAALIEQAQAA